MTELQQYYDRTGLLPQEITPGEIVHQTPNYQIITDFKPGLECRPEGARFFITPRSNTGAVDVLFEAAMAHNLYTFTTRAIDTPSGTEYVPALRADYISENIPPLFFGRVDIPTSHALEDHTIPSPDRMEACINKFLPVSPFYSMVDGEPITVPDPKTRQLRLLMNAYSDEIPEELIESTSSNRYFKSRKNWFMAVVHALNSGIKSGEFQNQQLVGTINYFLNYTYSDQFREKKLITPTDIYLANSVIANII